MRLALRLALLATFGAGELPPHPLKKENCAELDARLDQTIRNSTEAIRQGQSARLYLVRGSTYVLRNRIGDALADFDKLIELAPEQAPHLWQRGIALYYAERYLESARQFESYHTVDNVDRENGIWRFLAQARVMGIEKARAQLLEYAKDDRPPFPDLYEMYRGRKSAEAVLERIEAATPAGRNRESQLFYAHLYIGMLADVQNELERAERHLRAAVANPSGQSSEGGPGYMWQVARLDYERLRQRLSKKAADKPERKRP